ncbi:TPA: ZmpA/ZmpB/ZmpC family metallo-endopeptidase [Streptococcus suis]
MKEYQHSIFSIRKLSIGVVSLCIGTGLFLSSLTGLQVEASERIATSNQEIHFHYLLEEELSPEEKSRIVQQLPEDLRQEATYFLVYRPQSPKVLPATGEFVSHAAAWLAAGFIVLAIQTMGSKKARVVSLLYVTLAGSALPLLQVEALQSNALAHYNQTVTVKAGDLLPDGKLELASYDFVGYIIEDGKVGQTVSTEKIVEQSSKQSDRVDHSPANQTVSPEKEPVSEQVQTEGPGLQPVINYREEKIPLEIERIEVEDPNLGLGEVRLEAGQAGYRIHRYEESWLGGQLQSSRLLETKEEAGKPEILYRGTKTIAVQEEVTQVPSTSLQTAPPVRMDFQLQERVDRQVLSIPEERIETDRLAQGETEVEEGREGLLEITYQDVIVAGQVIASNELHRQETAPISRKVYVGTGETEEVSEQPSETLIPSHSPQTAPPVRMDFQLQERVDRQVLSIPEERIETDRLAQGETEVEEGREGLLEITYQDVIVAGQVIASNELHRQETAPISRKVYVGTGVDSKEVAPLTHSPATATLVSEEVVIPFDRTDSEDPDMAQGTSRVEPGQDGLALVTYAELDGVQTLLTSEEINPARSQVTYHGSRVDSKGDSQVTPLLPTATLVSEEVVIPFDRIDSEDPDMAQGSSRVEPGQDGLALVTYAELDGVRTLLTSEEISPVHSQVTYHGSRVDSKGDSQVMPLLPTATLVSEEIVIPFDRIDSEDPDMAQGTSRVEPGQDGLALVTYAELDGVRTLLTSEEISPARSQVTYHGSRVDSKGDSQVTPLLPTATLVSEEVVIPFDRIDSEDPDMAQGTSRVEPGQDGLALVTYAELDGVRTLLTSEEISPARSQVTYHGSRVEEVVLEEELPLVERIIEIADQYTDYIRIEQAGYPGRRRIVSRNGQVISEETQAGQERIVHKGIKPIEGSLVEEVSRSIAFRTIYQADPELDFGRREEFDGQSGQEVIAITYRTIKGQKTEELGRERVEFTPPVDKVVRVGTKTTEEVIRESLPTRYEADETDPVGQESPVSSGREKVTVYQTTYAVDEETGIVSSHRGQGQIREIGESPLIRKGTKPTLEIHREPLPLIYQADTSLPITSNPVRQEGRDKVTTITTTYTLNPSTGEITANAPVSAVTDEGEATIVRVGAQPTVREENQTLPTIYRAREDKEPPYREEVVQGQARRIRYQTNYVVDPQTGNRTAQEEIQTVLDQGRAAEVEVGTKAPLVTHREPLPLIYQADTSLPITSEPVRQEGRDKVTTITTSYTLNPSTGEITANAPVSAVTDEGEATIVRVGAQPTVREENQTLPTIYRAREDKEPPYREEVVQGQARRIRYQTNYVVDPQTGNRTAQEEIQTVLDQGRAAEVEVGTQATLVRETIPHRVIRQDDMDLPIGEEIAGPVGQDGSITRTTSYRLDERTGQLESLPVQIEEIPARDQVIRVGKKVVEEPPKQLEKPSVVLGTDTHPAGLVVNENALGVDVYYRVTDPDKTLESVQLAIYDGDRLVKTVEQTPEFAAENQLQLRDLQAYVAYQARLSFRYRNQDGQAEETVATLPFDISPKSIEFRDVTSRELYRLTRDNELERVTSLVERPSDLTKYVARYKTDHQREILLTVASIEEVDGHYKVKVNYPKLVQNRTSDANSLEESDYFIVEKVVLEPGAYTDFGALLTAMKANTSGTFKLAADLVAGDIQENTYIPQFSGRLESVSGKNYKILNLRKPLFGQLTNATIQNITLSEVTIEGGEQKAAALAQTMTGGKVENVWVDGRIQSSAGVAGLVHTVSGASFRNVVFKGQLDLSNITDRNTTRSAGLVGDLRNGSITNAYIDVDAVFSPRRSMMDQLGGLVGYGLFSQINNVYLTGKIQQTEEGSVAGIAAGEYGSQASNVLTNLQLSATAAMAGLRTPLTLHATDKATGTTPATVTVQRISEDRISSLLEEWGMAGLLTSPSTGVSTSQTTANQIDFSQLQAARPELVTAYRNMAKLLPFYDRHTIVRMGNRVEDTSPLNRSLIQSILPVYKGRPLQNLYVNKEKIEQLLIYFQDGSVEVMDVEHIGPYENTGITEYRLGRDLLYTPDQWLLSAQLDSVLAEITNHYQGLDVESEAYALKTKMAEFARSQGQQFDIRQLYLKSSQDQLKANLSSELGSIIDRQWISDLSNPAIQSYIAKQLTKEKESIWLGLTYLHRHYNIDFQNLNIQDLMKFRPDFYGQKISVLDWLKRVGSLEFEKLLTFYAPETYSKYLSDIVTTDKNLISYLEYNRQLFSPTQTNRAWFESATKAFLYTDRTAETDERSNHVYDHLKRFDRYHKYLLPILTIPEENELTVVSTAHLLSFGGYGRYVDMNLAETQPQVFDAAVRRLKEQQIPKSAALWSQFVEFWKGVISESARTRLQDTSVLIWDGYLIKDSAGTIDLSEQKNDKRRWAAQFGDSYRVIDDFFGPVFKYYPYAERVSASAEMNLKQYIDFGNTDVLTGRGDSTLSHELIHLFEDIILDLHGKRRGQDSESYAMGLLQSVASSNAYYYGFNFMGDLPESSNHNSQAGRLQSATDLQEYMKGSFDTTYFLDAMEMQVMLGLDRSSQKKLLRKIQLVKETPTISNGVQYADSIDRISDLTDIEWNAIQLTNTDSFVDHQLVLSNTIAGAKDYLRDNIYNYYFVPLFYPIYAGLLNDQGTVGGLQFRRTALELLAKKGWQEGFIPYASDALRGEAESMQKPLSDEYIWKKVMPDYDSYSHFKKERYRQMVEKQGHIKPVQIVWNNTTHQISSGQDIQVLMQAAIQEDLANLGTSFKRQQLKEALYKAFHEVSQEFRESIFLPAS